MPSSRRKTRRRPAEAQPATLSDLDLPDSSPTQPSPKKRKVNGAKSTPKRKAPSPTPDPIQGADDSGADDELVSETDLIDSVVSYLQLSKDSVVARREFANDKEPDNAEKVSAYAKIAGRDWTYFVREQVVNFGRPPDERQTNLPPGASSPIQDLKDVLPVHIDLGPSKIVSRHHAAVFYDAEYPPDEGGWHVRVNGRNGVRVNNVLIKRGGRQQLRSGAVLEIAGTQMMFVTPRDRVQIDPYFLDKAKAAASEDFGTSSQLVDTTEIQKSDAQSGFQSLAPAPPNFKRTSTPPPQPKAQTNVFDSKSTMSPMYGRGMMMESTQEIDYARDSAKDLKPPHSYATMIAQAIFSSEEEKLTLSNIYTFIADKYAFYRHSNSGWQNSIRHNLSLNKAFQKVPRRTDEPGKGMKWQIAPEYRQEYYKKALRRPGQSSTPSSPALGKDVNPNFRGPNGQNLGYDTSMVSSFSTKNAPRHHPQMQPFPQFAPPPGYGPPPPLQPPEALTPLRRRTDTQGTVGDEDSPAPHVQLHQATPGRPQNGLPMYTLPSSGPGHHSPPNPTLSSSFLDTPFHPNHHNMITPAPLRQNPRLAPPSTLVAPSKFMPESSPAGPGLFWKGLMGVTPGQPLPDLSPVKENDPRNGFDRNIMSSSPPPMMEGNGSPTKSMPPRSSQPAPIPPPRGLGKDIRPYSNTNGINTQPPNGPGPAYNVTQPPRNGSFSVPPSAAMVKQEMGHHEVDEGDGGFDLAKGFAPIRSFHNSRSGSIPVAKAGP